MPKLKLIINLLIFLVCITTFSNAQNIEAEIFHDSRGVPMVYVPSGEFQSGVELDDALSQCLSLRETEGFPPYDPHRICDSEFLAHSMIQFMNVALNAFYLDQYEVSRSNYLACVAADVCSNELFTEQSLEPSNMPIQYATFIDASIYCAWREARLPTAFEWEYAARGINSLTFPWGNEFDGNQTNHCDVNCAILGDAALQSMWDDGYSEVAPVDAFESDISWVGAFHMAGNVAEWTSTRRTSTIEYTDGMLFYNVRIIKGGSFASYPYQTAGWFTESHNLAQGRASVGFRCARTTEPTG